jgi:hypothetical protein
MGSFRKNKSEMGSFGKKGVKWVRFAKTGYSGNTILDSITNIKKF